MSYYIIPKVKNCVNVNPKYSDTEISKPFISCSLFQYYNNLMEQIHFFLNNNKTFQIVLHLRCR